MVWTGLRGLGMTKKLTIRDPVIIYRSKTGAVLGYNGCGQRVLDAKHELESLMYWNKYKNEIPSYDNAEWIK